MMRRRCICIPTAPEQQDADKRITEARTRGDEARADAAIANQRASEAAERAASLEKQAAELRLALERETAKRQARTLKKEQFDALQALKGKEYLKSMSCIKALSNPVCLQVKS
jgi:hypothetical protein